MLMDAAGTAVWVDKLEKAMEIYNSRPHRGIGGLSPREAEQDRYQNYLHQLQFTKWQQMPKKRPNYKVGDSVRILSKSKMWRGYQPTFTHTLFIITNVKTNLKVLATCS